MTAKLARLPSRPELFHMWKMRRVLVWRPTLKAIWDRWRGKRHPMIPLETWRVDGWKGSWDVAIWNGDWLVRVEPELTGSEKSLGGGSGSVERWD